MSVAAVCPFRPLMESECLTTVLLGQVQKNGIRVYNNRESRIVVGLENGDS